MAGRNEKQVGSCNGLISYIAHQKQVIYTVLIAAQSQDPENRIRLQKSGSKRIDTIFEEDWTAFHVKGLDCYLMLFTLY